VTKSDADCSVDSWVGSRYSGEVAQDNPGVYCYTNQSEMMADPTLISISKRTETEVDDFKDLFRRRKGLATVVVLIVAVPWFYSGYNFFWGVPKLKSQIRELKEELTTTKQELGSTKSQLAPYLAFAKISFPKANDTEKLELLLERVESVTVSLEKASKDLKEDLRGDRSLSATGSKQLSKNLAAVPSAIE